jgi:hypothetical protein
MQKPMTRPLKPAKEFHTEAEAARYLNISILELYALLDEYIFNDGHARPANLSFSDADLVLLAFWNSGKESAKVISMTRRD